MLTQCGSPAVQTLTGVHVEPVQPAGGGCASHSAPAQAAGSLITLTICLRSAGRFLSSVKLICTLALPAAGTLAMVTVHSVPAAAPAAQLLVPPVTLVKVAPAGTTSLSV